MLKVLLSLLFIYLLPGKEYERYTWDEKQQFTWADFKGRPDTFSPFAASINTGISQSYGIDGNGILIKEDCEVHAYFYPKLSWYKPKLVSPQMLQHERTHFAISELHARRLRKKIDQFDFTENSKREVKKLYKETEINRQEMQEVFDLETAHSKNLRAEAFWERKIAELLEEYAAWE